MAGPEEEAPKAAERPDGRRKVGDASEPCGKEFEFIFDMTVEENPEFEFKTEVEREPEFEFETEVEEDLEFEFETEVEAGGGRNKGAKTTPDISDWS